MFKLAKLYFNMLFLSSKHVNMISQRASILRIAFHHVFSVCTVAACDHHVNVHTCQCVRGGASHRKHRCAYDMTTVSCSWVSVAYCWNRNNTLRHTPSPHNMTCPPVAAWAIRLCSTGNTAWFSTSLCAVARALLGGVCPCRLAAYAPHPE